jgi:hypothetical protein
MKFVKDIERMKKNLKERVSLIIELMENASIYEDFDKNDINAISEFKSRISSATSISELIGIHEALKRVRSDIWMRLTQDLTKKEFEKADYLKNLNSKIENLENQFSTIVYDVEKLENNYKKLFKNPILSFIWKQKLSMRL